MACDHRIAAIETKYTDGTHASYCIICVVNWFLSTDGERVFHIARGEATEFFLKRIMQIDRRQAARDQKKPGPTRLEPANKRNPESA